MGGVKEASCVLTLFLFTGAAVGQNPQAMAAHEAGSQTIPATPAATTPAAVTSSASKPSSVDLPKISYVGGQLSIDALDATLVDILTRVAAVTGVKIQIPPGASSERLPIVKLGPGPARQVLASLLSGSSLDYLILASATEPERIEDLILRPREKKGSGGNAAGPAARSFHSPYARVPASPTLPDETPEGPGTPSSAEAANTAAQTNTPTTAQTDPSAGSQSPLSQSGLSPVALSNQSGLTTAGAMKPPGTLDQESINQQLQQMYQDRMQMGQQVHVPPAPVAVPSTPANP